jgi:uncharacterized protein YciI
VARFGCVLAFLLVAISFAAQESGKQAAPAKSQKLHYLIRLTPARAGFVENPTAAEQKAMGDHFARLKKLAAAGKIVVAGPSINGPDTFGIVVVEVESKEEATEIMRGDPSVKAGMMKGEVLPFNLAIERAR